MVERIELPKFENQDKEAKEYIKKLEKDLPNHLLTKRTKELKNIADNRDIIDLLDEEEREIKYLDLGEINGKWYYGLNVKGRESIILSDPKKPQLLRNTSEKIKGVEGDRRIGENPIRELFHYGDGYIGDIAPTISKDTVKRYLVEENKVDRRVLYNNMRDLTLYYMDFDKAEEIADVQTCWEIATFCYPLFYWFPHILFNAPSESGKSKNAFIMKELSFRGFDLGTSGGVSPAQIFRTLEGNRGTAVIDEYEQDFSKNTSDSQRLVNQILNASCDRDAYIIKNIAEGKKWVPRKFPIFSPKICCNISGINPTSLSRYIVFRLLKTTTKKGNKEPRREQERKKFKPLREDCHLLILQNHEEIKKIIDNLEIEDLSNREQDTWLPILAIAKFIGEDVVKNVKKYISTYKKLRLESNDLVATLFHVMYEKLPDEQGFVSAKEIASWMEDELSESKSPAHWVGRQIKNYGVNFRKVRRGTGSGYLISKTDVRGIIDRYFPTPKESTQTTPNTLSTQTTQTTPKDELSVLSSVVEGSKVNCSTCDLKTEDLVNGICPICREE